MIFRLGWLVVVLLMVQEVAAVPQWAFRISFTDKTGSPAVTNPSAFLSPRALARRTQQGIAVTDADRPVAAAYTDSVLHVTAGKLHSTSRWFNNCVILLDDSSRIGLLQGTAFIARVEWVGYFSGGLHFEAPVVRQETAKPPVRSLKGTGNPVYYGTAWAQTTMVNGDHLHDNGLRGSGQLIAVLDLGFSGSDTHRGFDSLRARNGIVDQFNFVNANTNVYSRSAHGTASLSTMAGLIPDTYVGSAPLADYALYIVDDVDYTDALYELDNVISALERADSIGADVITGSIGYNEFTHPYHFIYPKADLNGHTTSVAIAANLAVARGIFVAMSAGNEGGNSWDFLLTPGDADSVLTVGSVNTARTVSGFSSPGPNSGGRVKPDVCMLGEPASVFTGSNSITNSSGTSAATPQLSGWAACLRGYRAGVTPYELRNVINRSADRHNAPLAKYGYGIPDFKKALQLLDVDQVLPGAGLTVAPNPFTKNITLQLTLKSAAAISCKVIDISGRIVVEKEFGTQQGSQQLTIDVPGDLASGTYLVQTTIGIETYTNKVTRQ